MADPFAFCKKLLLTNATGTTLFGAVAAILTVFTGAAIPATGAGCMMFFNTVRITGKSSSKSGNSHQGGDSKHSFHKVRV